MMVNSKSKSWGLFKTKSKQNGAETPKKKYTTECIDIDSPTSVASDSSEEFESIVSGKATIDSKPRIMKNNAKGLSAQVFKLDTDEIDKYGYGDATPDDRSKYGYGDATPDDRSKYGYGEATPDDRSSYAYGATSSPRTLSRKTPRRSSMKQEGRPRRSSISFGAEIEVNLPGKTEPVKRRSSITFKESVVVKCITPVTELTSEPENLWFQDDEFARMKEKSKLIVAKVEHGETGGKKFCTRGLEKMMPSRRNQILEQKYKCWDAVLNEQELQRKEGIFDDDYMGNLCKFTSVQSQKEAAERAKQDAAEIENYLRSTRKFCRRLSM